MLKQIEKLEKAGLYKEADTILRKVISEEREYAPQIETETSALDNLPAQQGYSQDSLMRLYTAYRPLAYALKQRYGIDLFGLPKHLDTLMKATKASGAKNVLTNNFFPSKSLTIWQTLFKDPKATESVARFLQNFPELETELQQLNSEIRTLKGKNYFDWLKGIKSAEDFTKELKEIKNLQSAGKASALAKNTYNNLSESQKAARIFTKNPDIKDWMIKILNSKDKSRAWLAEPPEVIADAYAKYYPNLTVERATFDVAKRNPFSTLANNVNKVDEMKKLLEQAKAGSTVNLTPEKIVEQFAKTYPRSPLVDKAAIIEEASILAKSVSSTEGIKAAEKAAEKFPVLRKVLGPLGILLSIPAAFKWKQKLESGEEWSAKETSEFVQDLLNLLASASLFIPPPFGEILASVLGGVSIALMGGTYLAEIAGGKDVSEEEKITGDFDYSKEDNRRRMPDGTIKLLSPEEIKDEKERGINELISQATPDNFSDFNEWLKSKNMNYSTMKIIDILKALETWIPQSQFAKEFDWFVNPNEQNKSKRAIFEQKYLNLFNAYRKGGNISQSGASLAFNSLEDVKKAYDRQFSQNPFIGFAFRQSKPLKEIISTIQKEMAPGMPAGQKWFAEVPLNYSDKDLLTWYNSKYPNGVVTASANKIIKTATTFNLKKHKLTKTNS